MFRMFTTSTTCRMHDYHFVFEETKAQTGVVSCWILLPVRDIDPRHCLQVYCPAFTVLPLTLPEPKQASAICIGKCTEQISKPQVKELR